VLEPSADGARLAIAEIEAQGAFAELRIDALDPDIRRDAASIASLVEGHAALLTWRRPADGGLSGSDEETRIRVLSDAARSARVWCDIELDAASAIDRFGLDRERVVVSHHDMQATPDGFSTIVDELFAARTGIAKIATIANRTSDLISHVEAAERARLEGRSLVAVAMGEKGVASRVMGPSMGAPFTFCARPDGRSSAAGQVPLDVMTGRYRAGAITGATFVVGLIAGRASYSRSPAMHNSALAQLGIDGVYLPFAVDDLDEFLAATVRSPTRRVPWSVRGFSVTNPHKTTALRFVDRLDPVASSVGAVNTIVVEADGSLKGYNTDVEGALQPLEAEYGVLRDARVGILGAGGAARAVVAGLASRGAHVTVFARNRAKAALVASDFDAEAGSLEDVNGARLDVVVNATPVGTLGDSEGKSPVPGHALDGVRLVFDLVYAPERTQLLEDALTRGCRILGGRLMLATQAAMQFELWTGRKVSAERMSAGF